jgi:tripartite-type tricarboxylate transporter receptor subunit TctC
LLAPSRRAARSADKCDRNRLALQDLANAVLCGDVDVAFEYFAGFQSLIAGGQMTVLATTGRERAGNLPDVPTVMEAGVAGYEVSS